jgi:hypothetical protein
MPDLLVIGLVGAVMSTVLILPFWRIFQKAGHPGYLSLFMLVPGVNILMLFYLAFSDWPSLRRR